MYMYIITYFRYFIPEIFHLSSNNYVMNIVSARECGIDAFQEFYFVCFDFTYYASQS